MKEMLYESDLEFTMFMATRSPPRVARERFKEHSRTILARMYDAATESHLLAIRAAVHTNQKDAA